MSNQSVLGKWLAAATGASMLFLYLLYSTLNTSQPQARQFITDPTTDQFDAVRYIQENQLLHTLQVQEPGKQNSLRCIIKTRPPLNTTYNNHYLYHNSAKPDTDQCFIW